MCVSRSGQLQCISPPVIISGPGRVLGWVRLCVCVSGSGLSYSSLVLSLRNYYVLFCELKVIEDYVVQRRTYKFLLTFNSNCGCILHCSQDSDLT